MFLTPCKVNTFLFFRSADASFVWRNDDIGIEGDRNHDWKAIIIRSHFMVGSKLKGLSSHGIPFTDSGKHLKNSFPHGKG